jgi:hypothetical protein
MLRKIIGYNGFVGNFSIVANAPPAAAVRDLLVVSFLNLHHLQVR